MVAQLDRKYIKTRPLKTWSRLISYALFEGRPLTTKGRWINPLVFGVYKAFSHLPKFRTIDKPIFILGTGRSGSTVLGKVLSMHKDLEFLNEPKALWAYLHNQEDLMGSYNNGTGRYRLEQSDASADIIKKAHRIFAGSLMVTGQKRFVDKYPELIFRTSFVSKIFPDAQYIFLTRNVDSTCTSISYWSERKGTKERDGTADWWGLNNRKWDALLEELLPEHDDLMAHFDEIRGLNEEGKAAIEWVVTMREGIKLSKENPNKFIYLPYDELCANSAEWINKLSEFLHLPNDSIFQKYASETLLEPAKHGRVQLPTWLRKITDTIERDLEALK